jgi:hypothetical protein
LKKWNKELGRQIVGVLNDVNQFLVASQGVPTRLVLGPEKELVQLIVDPTKRSGGGTLLKKSTKRNGNGRHQIFCAFIRKQMKRGKMAGDLRVYVLQ